MERSLHPAPTCQTPTTSGTWSKPTRLTLSVPQRRCSSFMSSAQHIECLRAAIAPQSASGVCVACADTDGQLALSRSPATATSRTRSRSRTAFLTRTRRETLRRPWKRLCLVMLVPLCRTTMKVHLAAASCGITDACCSTCSLHVVPWPPAGHLYR